MNGYLRRIALSALKPGGSIQPILGSVFSPPNFANGPEALSKETAQPVTAPGPSEFAPRTDLQRSPDAPGARVLPALEPDPKGQEPVELIKTPIPTSNRFFTSLVPGPKEKAETPVAPLLPVNRGNQHQERTPEHRREITAWAPPKQKVDDRAGQMAPRMPIVIAGTSTKRVVDNPGAEPAHGMAVVTAGTSTRPVVNTPGAELAHGETDVTAGISTKQVVNTPGAEPAHGKAVVTAGISTKQVVNTPGAEPAPSGAVARQDFRKLVPSTSSPFISGAGGNESMGSLRGRSARTEPDEIQIHIGRIEVVAVPPPAPKPSASPKPQRGALSLDDYLRRRDRRA
jgi:hypothetical protein